MAGEEGARLEGAGGWGCLALSAGGRPVLGAGEAELAWAEGPGPEARAGGGALPGLPRPAAARGAWLCSTLRLAFAPEGPGDLPLELPLREVAGARRDDGALGVKRARVRVDLRGGETVRLRLGSVSQADRLSGALQQALRARAWERPPDGAAQVGGGAGAGLAPPGGGSTPGVRGQDGGSGVRAGAGVLGLVRREEQVRESAGRDLTEAFQDLGSLMEKAAGMVDLARRLEAVAAGGAGASAGEQQEARELLQSLGAVCPVTKEAAGALFHQQLARQLADFLQRPLEDSRGLLPLTDVYCLYNRARGSELVSPGDLLAACELFPTLGLPLRLRRLQGSGALCVEAAGGGEAEACGLVVALARDAGPAAGVGPAQVASSLGVSLGLAAVYLELAEERLLLCRDDGPEGLRFAPNFFADLPAPA